MHVCYAVMLGHENIVLKGDHLENMAKLYILWPYLPEILIQKGWKRLRTLHFNKHPKSFRYTLH